MAKKPILSPGELASASIEHLDVTLKAGTDLECIVLGVGYLEQVLATLIRQAFVEGDLGDPEGNTEEGRMEKVCSDAINSMNLDVRSRLAYCLGLISEPIYKNVETLRIIGNDCAHNHLTVDFDKGKINDLCKQLIIPADVDKKQYCQTRRATFCTVVKRISVCLWWETVPQRQELRKMHRPLLSNWTAPLS